MPSLRGLVQGWGDMHSSRGLDVITGVLSLAVLIWAATQWRTTAPSQSKLYLAGIATAVLATFLAGYHASSYDMSLLFPVVLLAANTGLYDAELDAISRGPLLLGAGVLLYAPLYFVLMRKGQMNLLAVPVMLLAWGFARAVKVWQPEESVAAPASVFQESRFVRKTGPENGFLERMW